ncbi:MAG: ABC transporter substrate-binding protein [Acidimicrobiales bacterium]
MPDQDDVTGRDAGTGEDGGRRGIDRRTLLKMFGAGAVGLGASATLAACGSSGSGNSAGASPTTAGGASAAPKATGGEIKIGYITPKTGPLAPFSQSDSYILTKIRASAAFKNGITVGGKRYSVKIIEMDSQSTSNRAAQVTQQLAQSTKVDLILTANAPETTNPVATACQQYQVPSVATVCPWESWYAGLGGNPGKPTTTFQYCTLFFFGMKEFAGTFLPMWDRIQKKTGAPKVFGGAYPNDADGNAFRAGFPPYAAKKGYKFVTGGAYTDGQSNYSSMIDKFKSQTCAFFSNAPLPPTFNTFWKEAITQGYKPKLATVAKVLLFPSTVTALGSLADNIATDAWWTPFSPYKSSLTGESCKTLGKGWQDQSGKEWWQSLGSAYSLFEVAAEGFKAVDTPHDHAQVAAALHKVSYTGMCGPLDFASGPAPGVGIILPVGVQWRKGKTLLGKKFPYEAYVVDNSLNKHVPITGDLEAGTY